MDWPHQFRVAWEAAHVLGCPQNVWFGRLMIHPRYVINCTHRLHLLCSCHPTFLSSVLLWSSSLSIRLRLFYFHLRLPHFQLHLSQFSLFCASFSASNLRASLSASNSILRVSVSVANFFSSKANSLSRISVAPWTSLSNNVTLLIRNLHNLPLTYHNKQWPLINYNHNSDTNVKALLFIWLG